MRLKHYQVVVSPFCHTFLFFAVLRMIFLLRKLSQKVDYKHFDHFRERSILIFLHAISTILSNDVTSLALRARHLTTSGTLSPVVSTKKSTSLLYPFLAHSKISTICNIQRSFSKFSKGAYDILSNLLPIS